MRSKSSTGCCGETGVPGRIHQPPRCAHPVPCGPLVLVSGWGIKVNAPFLKRLVLFVLLVFPSIAAAGDTWPGWRGPTGLGSTDEKGLPLTWGGKNDDNVLWKAPLPGADSKAKFDNNQSSPIVWKDRVFVIMVYWPEGVAQSKFPEHHVACYSTADGKKLWDTKVPPGPWLLKDLRGGYSAPTPCTDGERIYALFGSSVLAALDFDGKIVWRKEVTPYAWDVAVGTSPILYQDAVLILADGTNPQTSRLVAFDKFGGGLRPLHDQCPPSAACWYDQGYQPAAPARDRPFMHQ